MFSIHCVHRNILFHSDTEIIFVLKMTTCGWNTETAIFNKSLRRGCGGGGCWAADPAQTPQKRNLKTTDFVDTMISKVLRDFPFILNQPLKSADDQYIRILKNIGGGGARKTLGAPMSHVVSKAKLMSSCLLLCLVICEPVLYPTKYVL
jgi:hypothetical protein